MHLIPVEFEKQPTDPEPTAKNILPHGRETLKDFKWVSVILHQVKSSINMNHLQNMKSKIVQSVEFRRTPIFNLSLCVRSVALRGTRIFNCPTLH